ncbi:MAG: DUF2071 domain-containing protein [Actinobacteria bacterium]|nr:MAG: DUF2071 domain-containing protein [Actinomycetota bacterium]
MTTRLIDRLSIRRRPAGLPLMRQWWGKLLFMHWPVPAASLRPLVAPHLSIDMYEGQAWVGIVPFTMWGVRPYFGPPVPGLSSFHELNVRTYVHHDGVPGVWFLSMDINSPLARWGGRQFFYLPYYDAEMSLRQQGQKIVYSSRRTEPETPPAVFDAAWTFGEPLPAAEPDSLDFFLTERYCLYSSYKEQLYRCRVFHQPWPLRRAEVSAHNSTLLETLGLPAPNGDPLLHYAEALKIDIWPLRRVAKVARASAFEAANASESLG